MLPLQTFQKPWAMVDLPLLDGRRSASCSHKARAAPLRPTGDDRREAIGVILFWYSCRSFARISDQKLNRAAMVRTRDDVALFTMGNAFARRRRIRITKKCVIVFRIADTDNLVRRMRSNSSGGSQSGRLVHAAGNTMTASL